LLFPHKVHLCIRRLCDRPIVLPATNVGAEPIIIRDPHALPERVSRKDGRVSRKNDPAEHWVNGDLVGRRAVSPVCQIVCNELLAAEGLPTRTKPDLQALAVAVIAVGLIVLAFLKGPAANGGRQIKFSRRVGSGWPRMGEELRVIA